MKEPLNEIPNLSQLEPLVSELNAEQQLQLRQALVRQAIYYVSQALPPQESDDGHRCGSDRAAEWLKKPTVEVAHNAYIWAVGECWDGGVRYFDYPEYFLFPVWVLEGDIALQMSPPHGIAWEETIAWERIIQVCFKTGDWMESDHGNVQLSSPSQLPDLEGSTQKVISQLTHPVNGSTHSMNHHSYERWDSPAHTSKQTRCKPIAHQLHSREKFLYLM